MLESCVFCDLETTGLNPEKDEIIEIALVRLVNGEINGTWHSLVRPRGHVPVNVRRLTGLDDAQLAGAPELGAVLPAALHFIGHEPLVGHNISFDRDFLAFAAGALPNPVYDTLELSRVLFPSFPGHRLAELCRRLNLEHASTHRALDDSLATAALYRKLLKTAAGQDARILLYLAALLQTAGSPWAPLMEQIAWQSAGTGIERTVLFTPAAPETGQPLPAGTPPPEDSGPEQLAAMFEPGGPLSGRIPGYEYRPEQQSVVAAVARAFAGKKFLLVEAGTGTGKSMAYIIPALYWSLLSGERVVLATRTINLQEQLWNKDIPLVQEALPAPCRAALVKGRQNYLCLRRWLHALSAGGWSPPEAAFMARILLWAAATTTGDRSEINLSYNEQEWWLQICADSEACLGTGCRWYSRDCFVTRARRRAEAANLIIVNHSLLLSDVRADNRVLPAYGPLVIDEAHHLEDAATEQLGRQLSRNGLRRWLNGVYKLIRQLGEPVPPRDAGEWLQLLQEARLSLQQTRETTDLFFNTLIEYIRQLFHSQNKDASRCTLRLKPPGELPVQAELDNLSSRLKGLLDCLTRLQAVLEAWQALNEAWAGQAGDVTQQLTAGEAMAADLLFILNYSDPEFVYWVETTGEGETAGCTLHAAPVQVGEILYRELYQNKETIVFTSATLTVDGSFEHFAERTGINLLPAGRVQRLQVDSPFQYDKQSLLCIVRDIPGQGFAPENEYYAALVPALAGLVRATRGRMLALFSSHRVLQETYRLLKPACEEMDICLLGHNIDGSRSRLMEEFTHTERALLFGASSFWEGVDIPGQALSCVVIVKLPFGSPGAPVVEARLEQLARAGKDGFRHYSLPQAIIRFKQGFGRLIRSVNDRGAVVVLDSRLVSKKYGRLFLNSLPLKSHIRGDLDMIIKRVSQWMEQPVAVAPNRSLFEPGDVVHRFPAGMRK
ncbi:helicase C-terminal domain-containing protein [Desulfotomaculum copahuensis]|uniref:3'-5' exonuclease DinG n=1 Tax=Desulfotomaculum copahuensis TaxID=1838280 RepID=A0A1B7LE14_9FIRM|nr:helicase C-terminal domain-containing protein [Desulfotomaculum copahuensis]OAT81341.1 hypothetical protein A6M21_10690 [Desulfotomaculum copahuensis]